VACHLENVPAGHLGNALQSVLDGASTISATAMPAMPMMLSRHCRRWPTHPGYTRVRLHFWYFVSRSLFNTFRCARRSPFVTQTGSWCCVTHCARRTNQPSLCTEGFGYDCTAYRQRTTRTLWSTARPCTQIPAAGKNFQSAAASSQRFSRILQTCKLLKMEASSAPVTSESVTFQSWPSTKRSLTVNLIAADIVAARRRKTWAVSIRSGLRRNRRSGGKQCVAVHNMCRHSTFSSSVRLKCDVQGSPIRARRGWPTRPCSRGRKPMEPQRQ
jgi:hypothetical protein